MVRKKIYITETDKREIHFVYPGIFPFSDLVLELHQLDLMKILKSLKKNNNKTLINKISGFINKIDKREKVFTDFDKEISRSDIK